MSVLLGILAGVLATVGIVGYKIWCQYRDNNR